VAVADEIDALAQRAKSDLDDLFNFGAHIHLIWKHFKVWVHQGNTLKSKNLRTGTEVTEQDLIKLYARYRTTYLLGLSFVQLVTVFEAFLFDFLRLLLTHDPRHLAQKKQIEVGVALSAADRGALVLLINIYLDKARTKARYAAGDKVVIDRLYFDDCWALAKKLARFTVELQTRRDVLSFSRGERGEPRLRGRAGTAG